jgi:Uma2 family endonuclease
MARNNPTHSHLVVRFGRFLDDWCIQQKFGTVFGGDVAIITKRDPDTGRGADLAVVSFDRLKAQPAEAAALQVSPELIIEVVSPGDLCFDIMDKLAESFHIGTGQVWIVTPSTRTLQVYRSVTDVTGYSVAERPVLVESDLLPGLKIDLREVFADVA